MARNGLDAKAIAHAKWASTLQLFYAKKFGFILKMAKNGLNAKAIAHAKWANMRKTALLAHYSFSMQKNGSRKQLNIRKMRAF